MKEVSMSITVLFVISICCLIASAFLYFKKETNDYASAATFTAESKKLTEIASERADSAVKATSEVLDSVVELNKKADDFEERIAKLEKETPAMNISLSPQTKPILVEVIDRRPSKLVPEAARKAKETLQRSRLSN
jgi:hypothetical protein